MFEKGTEVSNLRLLHATEYLVVLQARAVQGSCQTKEMTKKFCSSIAAIELSYRILRENRLNDHIIES